MTFQKYSVIIISFKVTWSWKIVLCFQFGGLGTLEQHGFARNRLWAIDDDPPPFPTNTLSKAFVDLILKPSEEDSKNWPHWY